jgi:hypothetical protein
MTVSRQATQSRFAEVRASSTPVFILDEQANHPKSMQLLKENGLRPLTYTEELVLIDQNPKLKEQLVGNRWWLGGEVPRLSSYCTFDKKGELTQGKGKIEETVYVFYKGNQPLSFLVLTDDVARFVGGRYVLGADLGPSDVASMVVGVKDGHGVAMLQGTPIPTRSDLLESAQKELAALRERGIGEENIESLSRLARGE